MKMLTSICFYSDFRTEYLELDQLASFRVLAIDVARSGNDGLCLAQKVRNSDI